MQRSSERAPESESAPPSPAPAAAVGEPSALAGAIGNNAFTALAARAAAGDDVFLGKGPQHPLLTRMATTAAPLVARQPPGGTATAAPPQQQQQPGTATGTWTAPLDFGTAANGGQAVVILFRIRDDAQELVTAGFPELGIVVDEAKTWIGYLGSNAAQPLSADDARKLTDFGREFQGSYRNALEQVAKAIVQQLLGWEQKPISEDDLFELREAVHEKFVHSPKDDVLTQTTELLKKAEDLVNEVDKWVGYGAKAKHVISQAKKLEDLKKGTKEISDKIGEAKKLVQLARDVGKMVGVIGKTPAGTDDIGALEGALDVSNFVVSKLGVPGFKQLWDGYIYKAAKACLTQLRKLKDILYKTDREGGLRLFFEEHRHDAVAPNIKDALVHGVDTGQHFPGGQAMLNFMWQLMRDPDSVTSVPAGIEDYFVEWRKQMNVGMDDEIKSDSSLGNLWNLFSRERAPNLLPWLRRHKDDAWVKLYGGMPKPG